MKWPSTTDIIKFFGLAAGYEEFSSDEATQRGKRVHAACHMIGQDLADNAWEARHPECVGYLDAYRKFLREHRFRLLQWEGEFKSETHRFVSHPDQLGVLDRPGLVNLELKSGSMPDWCPLQTGGQVLAIGDPAIRRYGLLLRDDGTYRLFPHEDFRDIDRFRSMVETWWTIQEFRDGEPRTNDRG
jgi:hypothetical protein